MNPPASTCVGRDELFKQVASLVPQLTEDKYKGQAGKVGVIGGCREYTGAPFFAAYSALKAGADLSHVFCTRGAATVIKTYSPELIVHPYLPDSEDGDDVCRVQQGIDAVGAWLDRFDVLVVGPGLGRNEAVLNTVAAVMTDARKLEIPLVIDADGLWIVNHHPEIVRGYDKAVLTPNAAEFRRLASKLGAGGDGTSDVVEHVARNLNGPIIVRKGGEDIISDGQVTIVCSEKGSLRRAGGQGDVLSGMIAAFVAWSARSGENLTAEEKGKAFQPQDISGISPLALAAYGGCWTVRRASRRAFERHGRAMGAPDVIAELGRTVDEDLAPCQ